MGYIILTGTPLFFNEPICLYVCLSDIMFLCLSYQPVNSRLELIRDTVVYRDASTVRMSVNLSLSFSLYLSVCPAPQALDLNFGLNY